VAIEKSRKRGINQPLILVSGVIFLLGAILTYLFILRGVYGKFNAADLAPDLSIIKSAISTEKPTIAILYSKYTENMLPDGNTWLNDNIITWKKFLDDANKNYEIIADSTIELGLAKNYDLLVLPGSKSLSDKEIMEIKKYLENGGSVFATSGIASYSDDGKWRGWDFFSEIFGLKFTKEIKNDSFTKIHTLRGGLPLTAGIPTGFPLNVATWDLPIAVEVMDPRTTQASFWYNYKLEDGLVRENIKKTAGIVYGNYGKGRFVWMGFEINSIIGAQEDYIYFDKLFTNSIKWLIYRPIAFVKEWPAGYDAAAMLAPTINKNPHNIENLENILESENVKASFFVSTKVANENKNLIKSLTNYGNIAPLVDIGYLNSINDTVNILNDYNTQSQQFLTAKKNLENLTGTQLFGSYPLYGLYDQNTLKALIKNGYKYVVTDSLTNSSVPQSVVLGDSQILSMTKTARDDYEVIRDFGLKDLPFQFYTYQEDIDRILFEGGMYLFKMHTEYQCTKENISVVKDIIKELKRKNFWIATGNDIAKWYAMKGKVEIKTDKRGPNRITLTISNPGKEIVNNMVIQLNLNNRAKGISLSTEIIGTKKATYDFDKKGHIVYVYINDLRPGESRTYYVDYQASNS